MNLSGPLLFAFAVIFYSCDSNEQLTSCGEYDPLSPAIEYELKETTFKTHQKLELLEPLELFNEYDFFNNFTIEDGDHIVLHLIRFSLYNYPDSLPFPWDVGHEMHLLFQINNDAESIIIPSSKFRDHKVFYRYASMGAQHFITVDEGCIYLAKMNADEWRVSVNLTYFDPMGLVDGTEKKQISFTEIFKRGQIAYDDSRMSFGQ